MSDHGGRIIIVKKKKKAHHAHHGGSWKVAYADFVTAMMAFFLVMWIMGMDQGVKDMVQGYFQNPVGFKRAFSGGRNPMSAGNFIVNLADNQSIILNRQQQERQFQEVIEEIERRIEESGLLDHADANVEMVITQDGLRIEFMETGQGATFFEKSSADLTPALRQVLQVVGSQLGRVPGDVILEGHTDALAFPGVEYSN
ncbi:MAG: hypothetical protein OEZ37_09820, partial [Gemmatimonadota bacterium]|nr:hypothetical protein [Gemmatimonadota bacterium]